MWFNFEFSDDANFCIFAGECIYSEMCMWGSLRLGPVKCTSTEVVITVSRCDPPSIMWIPSHCAFKFGVSISLVLVSKLNLETATSMFVKLMYCWMPLHVASLKQHAGPQCTAKCISSMLAWPIIYGV